MSELVKITYKGVGGFFLFFILLTFGITGIILALAGGLIAALSWIPFVFPELLAETEIIFFTETITDPGLIFIVLLFTGFLLTLVGAIFIWLTVYIRRAADVIDEEISSAIDANLPTIKEIRTKEASDGRVHSIERLANLHEKGYLTKEEFDSEKQKVLLSEK